MIAAWTRSGRGGQRGCAKVLSQGAPQTVREGLAELVEPAGWDGVDRLLDGLPDRYGDGPAALLDRLPGSDGPGCTQPDPRGTVGAAEQPETPGP